MPFQIIRNDITTVSAEAIVNTANPHPVIGDGTDRAIYAAAGEEKLLCARRKIGDIARGSAAATRAYRLKAKYIIHTVGPAWVDGQHGEGDTLRACYRNSLLLAGQLKVKSIAFPLISTGNYGYPKDEALDIALSEIREYLDRNDMDITLVVLDQDSFDLSRNRMGEIGEYISEHSIEQVYVNEYPSLRDTDHPEEKAARNFLFHNRRMSERRADLEQDTEPDEMCAFDSEDALYSSAYFGEDALSDESVLGTDHFPGAVHPAPNEREKQGSAPKNPASPTNRKDALAQAAPKPFISAPKQAAKPALTDTLDEFISHPGESFQEKLLSLIDKSGMDDVTVYKKANIDRKLFSRIRCKRDYKPKKKTAVAFAIALRLDMDTMRDLLASAELALSPGSKFDLIVSYFVTHGIYDIYEINTALFKYDQPLLGE